MIKSGELLVNNYVFKIEKDLKYYEEKKWKDYKVYYYLNINDFILDVYLDSKYNKIYLNQYKSNEIIVK